MASGLTGGVDPVHFLNSSSLMTSSPLGRVEPSQAIQQFAAIRSSGRVHCRPDSGRATTQDERQQKPTQAQKHQSLSAPSSRMGYGGSCLATMNHPAGEVS